jgi:thiol-disulfide isomerase/thioredoxin
MKPLPYTLGAAVVMTSVIAFAPPLLSDDGERGGAADARAVPIERVHVVPATGPTVLAAVRESRAQAVLVNVWATWCVPCREEFPDLVRLHRAYKDRGVKVLFVSGDFESDLPQVKQFLADHGVDFVTYQKTGNDMEFINTLDPDWSGALPATFVYDGESVRRQALLGKGSYAKFEELLRDVLDHRAETR